MKKKVFLAAMLIALMAVGAFAQNRSTPNPDSDFVFENGVITFFKGIFDSHRCVIPSSIGGVSVTEIGSNAFRGNRMIEQVVISASVHSIAAGAFQGSTLRWLTIQGTLRTVGDSAFEGTLLQTFTSSWPSGIHRIPNGLYQRSDLRKDLVIPEGIADIGDNAFRGTQIESVTLPRSIQRIGAGAFTDCRLLTTVTIPSSVTSIIFGDNGIFSGSPLNAASIQALITRGAPSRNGSLR